MNTRHVIIIRRDLHLSLGAAMAQAAHISDHFMRQKIWENPDKTIKDIFPPDVRDWMKDPYISVLAVNNFDELDIIFKEANQVSLPVWLFKDTIYSEILRRPILTTTGLSIGPADFDKIKLITGNLPAY